MKRFFLLTGCVTSLFLSIPLLKGQAPIRKPDKWIEYVEEFAAAFEEEEAAETLYTELSYRAEHPFDLNRVTGEELKGLPFLSDTQIEGLLKHRERNGAFLSLYELKGVEALDFQTIELLAPFLHIGEQPVYKRPITVKNLLKYGSNELLIRYDQGFQQKQGYGSFPDSILQRYPNRKYLGEPFYTSLRYAYTFGQQIQFGMTAEKDAGEPFWNRRHKGYDFYSAHLLLKDINGWLKTLAAGDYKISFGQGLVVSNDFSPSRNAIVAQAERRTNGFRRHFSTNENNFFRGIAATAQWRRWELSLFYSRRRQDAGVDSSLTFTSLKTDGLHRLPRDWEKRHTLRLQSYGGNLRYLTEHFHIGLTALSASFSPYRMEPEEQPYTRFYFRGSRMVNISVDYLLKNERIKLYGETARSQNGAWATLNALQWSPVSYLSLLLLHRYYDQRYHALFGNAFSQGGTVRNEQGTYIGLQVVPFAHWAVAAYADLFRFPWVKYGVDAPSSGSEAMAQVTFTPHPSLSTYLRYKYRKKEKNSPAGESTPLRIQSYVQQRLRGQLRWQPAPGWELKSAAEGIRYMTAGQRSQGMLLSQSVGWIPTAVPLRADLYAAWFHTDSYDSRLYSYERNLLYVFNVPFLYGHGLRSTVLLRWDLPPHLSLSTKLAHTHYFDRETIGSDAETIAGRSKTDLYLLLRWKF